jgi:D-cysteine desulfhydrase
MQLPQPRQPQTAEPELFRVAPELRKRLPWISLGHFPTPVDDIDVPGVGPVLVKRDDCCAAGYAGNKVRKLEFLLAAARAAGARRLITAGAAGSHHALATAYHGRRLGFDVSLVLFPQPLTEHVREIVLLDHAVGAELRWAARMEAVPYAVWRARLAHRAERPWVIAPGGSCEIGTLGYVSAGLELAEQLRTGEVAQPSRIHVAAGTLGTAAGIAIGLAWAGIELPIIATRITSRLVTNQRVLETLIRRTTNRLRRAGARPADPAEAARLVELRHDQLGAGYGLATPQALAAQEQLAACGLRLDVTYTAKAAAGLLASVAAADHTDAPPLLWQTLSAIEPRELLRGRIEAELPEPFARYLTGVR